MASYKRQYLNLYAPGDADSSKFCVQQKADECFLSREDKKLRFYAPDFVIRKKLATAIDEEDISVFDKFDEQKTEYDGYNAARQTDHSVLATTVAALQVTVASNKTSGDNADAAEVSARTSADDALSATITANKSAQDAGFLAAQQARAADKAELAQDIADEASARATAVSGLQT